MLLRRVSMHARNDTWGILFLDLVVVVPGAFVATRGSKSQSGRKQAG